jgi:hypothetical protein
MSNRDKQQGLAAEEGFLQNMGQAVKSGLSSSRALFSNDDGTSNQPRTISGKPGEEGKDWLKGNVTSRCSIRH